jgi:hypothetical protein
VPPDRNGTLMGVRQSRYVAANLARAVYVNGSAVLSHASSSTLPLTQSSKYIPTRFSALL